MIALAMFTMIALAMFTTVGAGAQTIYDATNIAQKELNGTARFVGMGGAMGALGEPPVLSEWAELWEHWVVIFLP